MVKQALVAFFLFASPASAATIYVDYADSGHTRVVGVFTEPQNAGDHPFIVQMDTSDDRYQAFLNQKPTTISASAFQARFTDQEQAAVWKAAATDPTGAIGAGLTRGLTAQQIDLTGQTVSIWTQWLVDAGAITSQRRTEILTP